MSRAGLVCLAVGAVALAALWALSAFAGAVALPSYLAAWLLCLGLPVGALALVMAAESIGPGISPAMTALRGVATTLPLLALLAIPVLLAPGRLYDVGGGAFAAWAVPILGIWSLLALVFMRAPARNNGLRRALAVIGFLVHLVIGAIAANLWVLRLDPHFNSTSFGLLFVVSQCAAAAAIAALLGRAHDYPVRMGLQPVLLVLLGAWIFLQFTQFLVVWSANLPAEVAWYQRRDAGLGRLAEWEAAGACLVAFLMLLHHRHRRHGLSILAAAVLVLLAHVLEAYWLVIPAFRQGLTVGIPDILALLGLGGVLIGGALAAGRWRDRHEAA